MARDHKSQPTSQLDAQRYFTVFRRLLERTAGPVGLVWGLTTVAIGVLTVLLFEPVIRLLEAAPPSPKVLLIGLLAMFLLTAFRTALYRPLRHLGTAARSDISIGECCSLAAARLLPVLLLHIAIGAILIALSVLFDAFGVWTFIPLTLLSFTLAPSLYFAANGASITEAIHRAVTVTRHHARWVLGIPALFLCIGSVVPVAAFEAIVGFGTAVPAAEPLFWARVMGLYVLYSYMRWLAVSSVYVALDNAE